MPTPEEIEKMKKDLQAEIDKNVALARINADAATGADAATKDLTSKLQSTTTERDTLKETNNKAAGQLEQLNADFTALTTSLNARLAAGDKVTIIRIEYGNRDYRSNAAVYAKLLNDILAKNTINVNNNYFNGDPLPNVPKKAKITYQWKDRVPVNVEVDENNNAQLLDGQAFAALYPSQ